MAILASAAILIIYLAVISATIKLRRTKQEITEKTFQMPGGLLIPLIAIVAIVWLLTSLSTWEIGSTIIFIAVICAIYFVMHFYKKRKTDFEETRENEIFEEG